MGVSVLNGDWPINIDLLMSRDVGEYLEAGVEKILTASTDEGPHATVGVRQSE